MVSLEGLQVEYLDVGEPQVSQDLQVDRRQLVWVDVRGVRTQPRQLRRPLRRRRSSPSRRPVALEVCHLQPLVLPFSDEVGIQGDAEVYVVDLQQT